MNKKFLIVSLMIELGLLLSFFSIPNGHAYIPLQVAVSPEAYSWNPDDAPASFQLDDPNIFQAAHFREALESRLKVGQSTFEQALIVMNWVRAQSAVADAAQAISGDPLYVHQAMLDGTPAQCGNFATLFATASTSVGLEQVRTWFLLSHDGLGGEGHVANEVWIPEFGKWVFLDPMNDAYLLLDGQAASLLEVREMLLTGQQERLEAVLGPNAHTSPDGIFDLYSGAMVVPSLAMSHTPLKDFYGQSPSNLPFPVDRALALVQGEATQVILLDDLARDASQPLPIGLAKGLLIAIVGGGLLIAGLLVRQIVRERQSLI